ncbi:MAG: Uma2 family endonuclease [Gemmataceae bacterium]|nr:Uma2 family endonuclease [Gemmataceae bacterium]
MATVSSRRRASSSSPPKSAAARPHADRLSVRIPVTASTLAGFRAWALSDAFPEHVRAAFIGQEIYLDMSNEELETHNMIKTEVTYVLVGLNRARRSGTYYSDGVLVTHEEAGVSNNPDGTFVTDDSLQAGRVRLVPRAGEQGQFTELEGTPDWAMEIVSNSSVEKDTHQLREAYHRAGIREYWLIDARGEEIGFQILYWRKSGYVAAPSKDGWQRSRVFGCSFRLERRRDPVGLWEYTLHVRPT